MPNEELGMRLFFAGAALVIVLLILLKTTNIPGFLVLLFSLLAAGSSAIGLLYDFYVKADIRIFDEI